MYSIFVKFQSRSILATVAPLITLNPFMLECCIKNEDKNFQTRSRSGTVILDIAE